MIRVFSTCKTTQPSSMISKDRITITPQDQSQKLQKVQVAGKRSQSASYRLCSIVRHDRLTCRRRKIPKDAYVAPIKGQRHLPHDLHLSADGRRATRPTTVTRGSNQGAPAPENF
ncbi:hypothetical protein HanIR_Chr11g0543861 [Helianthus annuus]|nr:hypothetical protein HanIR_Chr11g0543861 [Helianthus annuus]